MLAAGLAWSAFRPRVAAEAPVIRANFDLPPNACINDVIVGPTIAVSPNGGLIAFTSISVNGFRMYMRRVNEIAAREIGDANIAGRNLAFSPDGRWLAFTEGNVLIIREPAAYSTPRFSPDGRRVAVSVLGSAGNDIWIYDIQRNTFTRLTSDENSLRPEWSADGRWVIYISGVGTKATVQRQPADGSGPAELLYQPEQEPYEALVSPDNQWLIYRTAPGAKYPRDILAVRLSGDRTVRPLVTGPNTESLPRLSPDGKWLAYQSNESGRFEIYVRPFPGNGARVQVSDVGGTEPIWGRDGRSLYYRGPLGEVVHVDVTTGGSFSIGARKTVLTGEYLTDSSHPNWTSRPTAASCCSSEQAPSRRRSWCTTGRASCARRRGRGGDVTETRETLADLGQRLPRRVRQ